MYAVYRSADGALVSLTSLDPSGSLPAGHASTTIAQAPDATHVWDAPTHALITVTERPDGEAGSFHEELTSEGWRWYYLVGPVAFEAEAASATRHAQPTVNATKTYVAAHATEAQFQVALQWAVDYRDRLSTAITAAGGTPASNARVTKLNTLIANLGAMV